MKPIIWGVILALSLAATSEAGAPTRGAVCHFNPRPTAPDPGLAYGQYNCATSQYGESGTDWVMGGNTYRSPGDVHVLEIAPPPFILRGCERGREMQVLVSGPSFVSNDWIFPRFLDCP